MLNLNSVDLDPLNQCNLIHVTKQHGMFTHNFVDLDPFNQFYLLTKQHGMLTTILLI